MKFFPVVLAISSAAVLARAAELKPVFPPSPRLATTAAELAADEQRPDFAARKVAVIATGEKLLALAAP